MREGESVKGCTVQWLEVGYVIAASVMEEAGRRTGRATFWIDWWGGG